MNDRGATEVFAAVDLGEEEKIQEMRKLEVEHKHWRNQQMTFNSGHKLRLRRHVVDWIFEVASWKSLRAETSFAAVVGLQPAPLAFRVFYEFAFETLRYNTYRGGALI